MDQSRLPHLLNAVHCCFQANERAADCCSWQSSRCRRHGYRDSGCLLRTTCHHEYCCSWLLATSLIGSLCWYWRWYWRNNGASLANDGNATDGCSPEWFWWRCFNARCCGRTNQHAGRCQIWRRNSKSSCSRFARALDAICNCNRSSVLYWLGYFDRKSCRIWETSRAATIQEAMG